VSVRDASYTLAVAGTGFASAFFLERWLERAPRGARVLVVERGARIDHRTQIERFDDYGALAAGEIRNRNPEKPWVFATMFGGGSNYWLGNVPRMLPADFELASRYGVGRDWPIGYDALERFYGDVEWRMAVAGPSDDSPFPRSRPYPQPPHRFHAPDRRLHAAHRGAFFALPAARPTRTTARRPACCANGYCDRCPIDSKFTVLNEMESVFRDPRVTLLTEAPAIAVESAGGRATGLRHRIGGAERVARADLVALGANAIVNAHLLLRSGLDDGIVGRGLCEQHGVLVDVRLAGLDGFQGTTSQTGHGYLLYDGPHRRERAAALIETLNVPLLRAEPGRWRERLVLKVIYEELPSPESRVSFDPADPERPVTTFAGPSAYRERGVARLGRDLERFLAPLPVESIEIHGNPAPSEAHVLATTPMGTDPATSVVDADLVHHRLRNLLLLGSGAFPTAAPANPTLTLAALSCRAAERLFEDAP
jgi:choline dehydrogenase-like flavoprotein